MIREDTLMEWGFKHFPDIVTSPTMKARDKTCEQLQWAKVFSIIKDDKGPEFASDVKKVQRWLLDNSGLRVSELDKTFHECRLWLQRIRKKQQSDNRPGYASDTLLGRSERAKYTPAKMMMSAWAWKREYSAEQIYDWFDLDVPENINPEDRLVVCPWELFVLGPDSIKTTAKPVLKCPLCGEGRYTP